MNAFQNVKESVGLVPQPINNSVKIVNEIYYWFATQNQPNPKINKNKRTKRTLTQTQ